MACKCPTNGELRRRHCIPIIYTRGNHYDVGFDVGRTFSGLIHSFLEVSLPLKETYLPSYESPKGREIYEHTLDVLKTRMPQYIEELQGTADGAKVPFHKLLLLHLDDITPNAIEDCAIKKRLSKGCTTLCINQPGAELLCHNEDALSETLNHFYLVAADIRTPDGKREKFTSLCYAGHLPGYTMGYNYHGMIATINTIQVTTLRGGRTPRHFLSRALLGAKNMEEVEAILKDEGCGAGDACSINITFVLDKSPRIFYNVEMAPGECDEMRSRTHTTCAGPGRNLAHCNKLLRLQEPEVGGFIIENSEARMEALERHGTATCKKMATEILGDRTGKTHKVYQESSGPDDFLRTLATGIFDCIERTWSLYDDNPKTCEPLMVLPLDLKNTNDSDKKV